MDVPSRRGDPVDGCLSWWWRDQLEVGATRYLRAGGQQVSALQERFGGDVPRYRRRAGGTEGAARYE
jgi:hypothetical protein